MKNIKRCRYCKNEFKANIKYHQKICLLKKANLKKFFKFFNTCNFEIRINSNVFNYYNPPIPTKAKLRMFSKKYNIFHFEFLSISRYKESRKNKIYQLFLHGLLTGKLTLDDMHTHLRFMYDRYGFLTSAEYSDKMKKAIQIENWLLGKNYE